MNWSQLWETLKPRFKSFAWRTGDYVAVQSIAFVLANLNLVHLPVFVVLLISQVLGEGTKWLNNHTELFGARLKNSLK